MKTLLTGRKREIATLKKALASDESEMVSVIGRRRAGKTFLIQSVYKKQIAFEISGLQYAEKNDQLRNFRQQLRVAFPSVTGTRKQLSWVLLTADGGERTVDSQGVIDHFLSGDNLFEK